ncbi:hypothetical protein, partial [Fulvivirga aurantia]|uniref:hypothetical protein n=1 Tax=Fulvivirga aurantia TaxID=2529383 RepID=UPI001625AE69
DATKCTSAVTVLTVSDVSVNPVIGLVSNQDQISCDTANPLGEISVNADGTTVGYTFNWYNGQNTDPANEILPAPGANVTNLAAGIYTVKATNDATGCFATEEYTVVTNTTTPVVSGGTITDADNCNVPNGQIQINDADIAPGNAADYTYAWYDGDEITDPLLGGETTATLSGYPPGDYTVVATNNLTDCNSDPFTFTINDVAPLVTITEDITGRIEPATCAVNSGQLEVDASSVGNINGFNFEWYDGNEDFSGPPLGNVTNTPGAAPTNSVITNLQSGVYTVLVTNLDNGCTEFLVIDLPFVGAQEVVDASVTNSTVCMAPYDGALEVQIDPTTLGGRGQDEFDYTVYDGKNTSDPIIFGPQQGGVASTPIPNLPPGFYTIVATQRFAPNCPSVPKTVEILDNSTQPVIALNSNIDQTSCGAPNGSLSVTGDGSDDTDPNYSFAWYNSALPPAGPVMSSASTYSPIAAGDYSVIVTNNTTGCSDSAAFNISDNIAIYSITQADLALTTQDDCAPANGTAQVNNVRENGTTVGTAGYNFEWFDSGMTSISGPSAVTSISGLAAGDYFVQATNITLTCQTSMVSFTIDDVTADPV